MHSQENPKSNQAPESYRSSFIKELSSIVQYAHSQMPLQINVPESSLGYSSNFYRMLALNSSIIIDIINQPSGLNFNNHPLKLDYLRALEREMNLTKGTTNLWKILKPVFLATIEAQNLDFAREFLTSITCFVNYSSGVPYLSYDFLSDKNNSYDHLNGEKLFDFTLEFYNKLTPKMRIDLLIHILPVCNTEQLTKLEGLLKEEKLATIFEFDTYGYLVDYAIFEAETKLNLCQGNTKAVENLIVEQGYELDEHALEYAKYIWENNSIADFDDFIENVLANNSIVIETKPEVILNKEEDLYNFFVGLFTRIPELPTKTIDQFCDTVISEESKLKIGIMQIISKFKLTDDTYEAVTELKGVLDSLNISTSEEQKKSEHFIATCITRLLGDILGENAKAVSAVFDVILDYAHANPYFTENLMNRRVIEHMLNAGCLNQAIEFASLIPVTNKSKGFIHLILAEALAEKGSISEMHKHLHLAYADVQLITNAKGNHTKPVKPEVITEHLQEFRNIIDEFNRYGSSQSTTSHQISKSIKIASIYWKAGMLEEATELLQIAIDNINSCQPREQPRLLAAISATAASIVSKLDLINGSYFFL